MQVFIQIQDLYDEYCEMSFGYVAIDANTGETYYFTNYDKRGIYDPEMIYPLDPDYITSKLAGHVACCSYVLGNSIDIHPEVIAFIDKSIKMHHAYNKAHGNIKKQKRGINLFF